METSRDNVDFAAMAAEEFDFLEKRFHMEVVERGATRLVFASAEMFVAVFWGRGSYEVGAAVGNWSRTGKRSTDGREIPVPFLFDQRLPSPAEIRPAWIASSTDGVRKALRELSSQTKTIMETLWRNQAALEDAYVRWADFTKLSSDDFLAAAIRRRADQAWQAHDYVEVAQDYELIRERYSSSKLKPSELARLKYARAHAASM